MNYKLKFGNKKHIQAMKYIFELKKLEKKEKKSKADKKAIYNLNEKIKFNLSTDK